MSSDPTLVDRDALAQHRQRAHSFFLHEQARAEVEDRLAMVNKTFMHPAIVTPFPAIWEGLFGTATVVPDADMLDLTPGAHDLVIHAMALHWANDPVGQLVQCRRALRPDGLCLCLTLGGQTLHELRASLAQSEAQVTGGLSPRVLPMGEIRDLGALLQRAGFALPVADGWPLTVSYASALHLMRDLRAMGETNALSDRLRHPTQRMVLLNATQIYQTNFGTEDDRITATFEFITLTGWAPSDTQPKPLRPGSAQTRLSEALGAPETKLKD